MYRITINTDDGEFTEVITNKASKARSLLPALLSWPQAHIEDAWNQGEYTLSDTYVTLTKHAGGA